MTTIAIIGAAGFLGTHVVDALLKRGHNITAVTRQNGEIMLGDKPFKLLNYTEISAVKEKYEVIINLAYATSTTKKLIDKENADIVQLIKNLSTKNSKIIHTSTLAVFGFALEREMKPEAVKNQADYPYIVSKIRMENLLLQTFKVQDISILRLGNIWGPASEGWTVKIADNLLYQKPVAADSFGFSNITDVHNAADYIKFLAEDINNTQTFHHLAELGHINWQFWVNAIADVLHEKPVITGIAIPYHNNITSDLTVLKRFFSPSPLLFSALETRFLSFYLRNFIAGLPRSVKKPFNTLPEINDAGNDFVFLTVMSGKKQFTNHINPLWKPPVNEEESLRCVIEWMKSAGYLL